MPANNPEMQEIRLLAEECVNKDRAAKLEAADTLVSLCEECALPWLELTASVRERICRQVQLAQNGRCYEELADRLGVDAMDRRFCSEQVAGQLKSSTELMLEDVTRSRAEPLTAAFLLRFLRERNLLRALADVSCGVQEACVRRRQQQLLGRSAGSPMDSGYQSGEHSGADLVGVHSEPPDATLVKAVPVRSVPPSHSDADLKKMPKKLMLTYAQDGRETALDLVDSLKALGFRVLLLEKQRRHRLPDSYPAVQKWFIGMDYILPVLTPEYMRATQNLTEPRDESARRLASDVRFIYSLMCAEMERNGHVNYRVRAVVPDDVEDSLRDHPLYGSPLFRFPFRVSDVEMLAECLED